VFYTPWKFLNIPEGALLVLSERFDYMEARPYEENQRIPLLLKWILKQEVNYVSHHIRLPLHLLRKVSIKGHDVSEPITAPGSPVCSAFLIKLLGKQEETIKDVCLKRIRNYRLIDEVFLDPNLKQYRVFADVPSSLAPYVYPFRISATRSLELMIRLNKRGVPALPWSDLSPEVKNSVDYPLANELRREVITLPVHQDLTLAQINWMKKQILYHLGQ